MNLLVVVRRGMDGLGHSLRLFCGSQGKGTPGWRSGGMAWRSQSVGNGALPLCTPPSRCLEIAAEILQQLSFALSPSRNGNGKKKWMRSLLVKAQIRGPSWEERERERERLRTCSSGGICTSQHLPTNSATASLMDGLSFINSIKPVKNWFTKKKKKKKKGEKQRKQKKKGEKSKKGKKRRKKKKMDKRKKETKSVSFTSPMFETVLPNKGENCLRVCIRLRAYLKGTDVQRLPITEWEMRLKAHCPLCRSQDLI